MDKIKFFLTPWGTIHVMFPELRHSLPNGGHYYEGFGSPSSFKRYTEGLIISQSFLEEKCQEVNESEARLIHSELFLNNYDPGLRGGEFYTKVMLKDVVLGMKVLMLSVFHEVTGISPLPSMSTYLSYESCTYPRKSSIAFDANEVLIRTVPTSLVA